MRKFGAWGSELNYTLRAVHFNGLQFQASLIVEGSGEEPNLHISAKRCIFMQLHHISTFVTTSDFEIEKHFDSASGLAVDVARLWTYHVYM